MTANKAWKREVRAVQRAMGWTYTRALRFCQDMIDVARAAPGDTREVLVAMAKKQNAAGHRPH